MPKKGKSCVTPAQRAKIAAGRASGKTGKQIAEETGLAHSTVKKQALDDRTRTLLQQLKEQEAPRLTTAWELAVTSILADLRSRDKDAKRAARRDLLRFLDSGDPPMAPLPPPDEAPPNSMLLEEYLELYRKFELAGAAQQEQGK